MSEKPQKDESSEQATVTLPATVEKIIPPIGHEPEKAQISVDGAEPLFREIRIENKLENKDGAEVKLKKGAEVEITIAADPDATAKK
jgi:hypothetical protein